MLREATRVAELTPNRREGVESIFFNELYLVLQLVGKRARFALLINIYISIIIKAAAYSLI